MPAHHPIDFNAPFQAQVHVLLPHILPGPALAPAAGPPLADKCLHAGRTLSRRFGNLERMVVEKCLAHEELLHSNKDEIDKHRADGQTAEGKREEGHCV